MPEAELSLLFLRPLNQLGVRYIIGVAAILYGEPRFTDDLDLVVFLRHNDIPPLLEWIQRRGVTAQWNMVDAG